MTQSRLEKLIEAVLGAGLALSAALLGAGLLLGRAELLRLGLLLLMSTPAARVVVLTFGLLAERDWLFALVSFWILAVLASSLALALRY